jgi:hypothetical protein
MKMNAKQDARLLPVVELDGREYLIDVENRQFLARQPVQKSIPMHSDEGKKMVQNMQGIEWRTYAIESANEPSLEV